MEKLYSELAGWWSLMSAPEEYVEEAGLYAGILHNACQPHTVLELGSGGGNNASHLKAEFELTLVDLSEAMVSVSRRLNPECTHHVGDMRSVRLGRKFDAVFVHDAVGYMTTVSDLRAAVQTAYEHCRPGGAALLVPDYFKETFAPGVSHGGHDGCAGRGLRYLEWSYVADPDESFVNFEFAFLLRDADGSVRVVQDRHRLGIFARDTWLDVCRDAGFEPTLVPIHHTVPEELKREGILCRVGRVSG